MPRTSSRTSSSRRILTLIGVVLAVQLVAGLSVLAGTEDAPPQPQELVAASTTDLVDLEQQAGPPPSPPPLSPAPEPDAVYLDGRTRVRPSESEALFAQEFPEHAAARQRDGQADTFHWAVIVGVNDYVGATGNTLGSVADAQVLRDALLARGWREDHILLLTDRTADHDRIVRALEWLARSTDERSTVVFSSSGHIRHRDGRTALWPADNAYIWADDLGHLLGAIAADKMWISFQGCHAGGLAAPGVEGPDRIVTYSSSIAQKSYEDPETGHSLQGFYMFAEGFRDGWGDGDGDGRVSIQEAHAWGAPRAETRSAGLQIPVMVDGMAGRPFHLEVEPVPAVPADPSA